MVTSYASQRSLIIVKTTIVNMKKGFFIACGILMEAQKFIHHIFPFLVQLQEQTSANECEDSGIDAFSIC